MVTDLSSYSPRRRSRPLKAAIEYVLVTALIAVLVLSIMTKMTGADVALAAKPPFISVKFPPHVVAKEFEGWRCPPNTVPVRAYDYYHPVACLNGSEATAIWN